MSEPSRDRTAVDAVKNEVLTEGEKNERFKQIIMSFLFLRYFLACQESNQRRHKGVPGFPEPHEVRFGGSRVGSSDPPLPLTPPFQTAEGVPPSEPPFVRRNGIACLVGDGAHENPQNLLRAFRGTPSSSPRFLK